MVCSCVIIYTIFANQNATCQIDKTTPYVPVVTFSTQDNLNLLQQLKSGFERIINWNKYLSKLEFLVQNLNLNHLFEPSFQGVNRLFVLASEDDAQRTIRKRHYLPNVEKKDYNVTTDQKISFEQPVKNNKIICENIRKNCYWWKEWLHNWLFVRLYLL